MPNGVVFSFFLNAYAYTCLSVCRYEFLEELWLRRKGERPLSSIQFALMEQKLDPHERTMQSSKTLSPQMQALCAGSDGKDVLLDIWLYQPCTIYAWGCTTALVTTLNERCIYVATTSIHVCRYIAKLSDMTCMCAWNDDLVCTCAWDYVMFMYSCEVQRSIITDQ